MREVAPSRIPGLDGLRAIAIVLVLYGHLVPADLGAILRRSALISPLGVRLFFVLSGFLITTLLLREHQSYGEISLRRFYVRRTFRIFPAFYTYILVISLLVAVPARDLLFAVTYTMNFHEQRVWWVGHLWSLAVEEQFYLLWPFALVALGTPRALRLALGAMVLAPVLRILTLLLYPSLLGLTDQAFPYVVDTLATGCALAIARPTLEASPRYRTLLESWRVWPLIALCLAPSVVTRSWFDLSVSMTLANLGLALVVHRCVVRPPQFLGNRVLGALGILSYSLYLWQQPFLNRHSSSWTAHFPLNIALAVAAAIASYVVIERPTLKLGHKLAGR